VASAGTSARIRFGDIADANVALAFRPCQGPESFQTEPREWLRDTFKAGQTAPAKIGGSNMKKRILLSVSGLLLVAMPLFAQDDSHSKKPLTATGTISQDRETFVCDKDHKTLKVSNPAALRDMEGQHAKLTYRLSSAAGEIFVTSAATVQDPTVARNAPDPATPK
jgi:hypothetical protein